MITIANNGGTNWHNGQWHIEGNVGVGAGGFARLDTGDSGKCETGSLPQLIGRGMLGVKGKFPNGKNRNLSISGTASYDNQNRFQISPGWTASGRGNIRIGGSDANSLVLGFGSGVFLGAGVSGYQ